MIKVIYDTIPFITNSYFSNAEYNKSDKIQNNSLDLNHSIFIINFIKPENKTESDSLKFNDPNYMLFNNKKQNIEYNLPSINYYNKSNYIINDKKWLNDRYITKLLNDMGYDNIITPFDFYGYQTEETLFYQLLEINNVNTNNKIIAIFIFFYTENTTEYTNIQNSLFLNEIWNNIIYPYINSDEIIIYNITTQTTTPTTTNTSIIDKNKNKLNIKFDNFEYINFIDKISYNYYLKKNINTLENTIIYGKIKNIVFLLIKKMKQ